jgi:hypothetical protein
MMKLIFRGFMVLLLVCQPLRGQITAPGAQEAALRASLATRPAPTSRPIDPAILDQFLAVERVARLPVEQRALQVKQLYIDLDSPWMSSIVEGILSTAPPASLLVVQTPRVGVSGSEMTETYGRELDAAAQTMAPEEVADKIWQNYGITIMRVATRRRAMYVLTQHPKELGKLIDDALAGTDLQAGKLALSAIGTLRLKDFVPKAMAVHLAGGPMAQYTTPAIGWVSSDAELARPLIADIEKSPAAVVRHHSILRTLLVGQPADPVLVKLLESPDADIRDSAAMSLEETDIGDVMVLAPRLVKDTDERVRLTGLRMAFRLPDAMFATVRDQFLPTLKSESPNERVRAAVGFAAKGDPAGARCVLEGLKNPALPSQLRGPVSSAARQLVGSRAVLRFDMVEWGPDNPTNAQFIALFEQWITSNVKQP